MKYTKSCYYILILIFFSSLVQAQTKEKRKIVPAIGLSYQKSTLIDFRFFVCKFINDPHMGYTLNGPFIGYETNFSSSNDLRGFRIGLESNFSYLVGKISMVNYFNKNNSDFKITPEIGFSFLQIFSLTYGHNFSLSKYKSNEISSNKVGISIFLNKKLWSQK